MAAEVTGSGLPDGLKVGRSSGKLGFFGSAPVVQPTTDVTVGTDTATIILEIADLRAALVSLNIIAA